MIWCAIGNQFFKLNTFFLHLETKYYIEHLHSSVLHTNARAFHLDKLQSIPKHYIYKNGVNEKHDFFFQKKGDDCILILSNINNILEHNHVLKLLCRPKTFSKQVLNSTVSTFIIDKNKRWSLVIDTQKTYLNKIFKYWKCILIFKYQ